MHETLLRKNLAHDYDSPKSMMMIKDDALGKTQKWRFSYYYCKGMLALYWGKCCLQLEQPGTPQISVTDYYICLVSFQVKSPYNKMHVHRIKLIAGLLPDSFHSSGLYQLQI